MSGYTREIVRLRLKATECRLEAQDFVGPATKRLMLLVAEVYDYIADTYQTIEEKS